MKSISKENYLKEIYKLLYSNEYKTVNASQIADNLDISRAAVSEMLKKLSKEKLLEYEKYKEFKLTTKGEKRALAVLRKHRLWELFLMKVLDLNWSEVHYEAENLEHASSDFLTEKIDLFLGSPSFDPHGDPIPDANGNLPKMPKLKQLSKCTIDRNYKLHRVYDNTSEFMEFLTENGIELSITFRLINKLRFDNSIVIRTKDKEIYLSEKASDNLFVEELGD